ncbi:MAG: GTP-binding protein [Candidatus Omnitrophica bacterium]|nr:GTP-binding protein [Candidatus Omnitrophota bacterium]
MEKPHHNIVIAGDVDHGKSTLIGRLLLDTRSLPENKLAEIKDICRKLGQNTELAYLIDQLKEERENNMTIDTAQAFLKTTRATYTLIDAPGHVEFIKNMLTGAAEADAAVLIIDISQNIQEQTRRHAYLLRMLGIKNIFAVLNKIDLVDYSHDRFLEKKKALLDVLNTLDIVPINVIPVSAKEGINITRKSARTKWYRGPTLVKALDIIPTIQETVRAPFRFPVQDIYTIGGETILAGQIASGQITAGQNVIILPLLKKALVRSIKIFGKSSRKASGGESIGLVLGSGAGITRGCVISGIDAPPSISRRFAGNLFWFGKNTLKINDAVTITCATQTTDGHVTGIHQRKDPAQIKPIEKISSAMKTHEMARVTIAVKKPIVIEPSGATHTLGRFTVTQGGRLLGAGVFT